MSIRPYQRSDIELIAPLYDEFVQLNETVPYRQNSKEIYLKWLHTVLDDSNFMILVVEEKGSLVGFGVGMIQQNKPLLLPDRIGYIGMFIINSSYRRKGFGHALYRKLCDWFLSKAISEIQLATETSNSIANKFWNALGFETINEQKSKKLK